MRHSQSLPLTALIDSGADERLIDHNVALQMGIEPLDSPPGSQILQFFHYKTVPVTLLLIIFSFHIIDCPQN